MSRILGTYLAAVLLLLSCVVTQAEPAMAAPPRRAVTVAVVEILGPIDSAQLMLFIQQMTAAEAADKIVIRINSTGGSVQAGLLMSQIIEGSTKPVICLVDGYAMSMAMHVLASCKVRLMTERSVLMIHEAHTEISPEAPPIERANLMELQAIQTKAYLKFVVSRMNVSYEEMAAMVANGRQVFLDSDLAMGLGAVDEVSPSLNGLVTMLSSR